VQRIYVKRISEKEGMMIVSKPKFVPLVLRMASTGIAKFESSFLFLSSIALFAIMIIVTIDVVMRYIFNQPLEWAYDVISLYLMVSVFFFALSDTLHEHGHVSIDVLIKYIPGWLRHGGETIGYAIATFVFALVTLQAVERMSESYRLDEMMASAYNWITWPAYFPVVVGTALLTIRSLYRTVGHLWSIFTKEPLVELPPLPDVSE
jgi:TRAP-type C4-dicarboxylate transport system permease small subunit